MNLNLLSNRTLWVPTALLLASAALMAVGHLRGYGPAYGVEDAFRNILLGAVGIMGAAGWMALKSRTSTAGALLIGLAGAQIVRVAIDLQLGLEAAKALNHGRALFWGFPTEWLMLSLFILLVSGVLWRMKWHVVATVLTLGVAFYAQVIWFASRM